ncbi:type II toxin-antitoxin system RelE/ParE family toxin [Marinibaculum pumilum]|uniref:Toxin n=1 Tax=Marinibaculum pumilum TaxID=1766165 RepID=A0ABV7KZE0_9PROT
MRKIEFADEARDDLRKIAAYTIEYWGKAQARRYLDGLRATCAEIAAMPGLGKDVSWAAAGLRSFPCQSRVIYYRPEPQRILVLAIVHRRQDPTRRFPA